MKKNIVLGMPHLNYNGLDPIWLVKTLGDNHWHLLKDIKRFNQGNERLYASFFACEINFNKGQSSFKEDDTLAIDSKIFKFNNLIYRSMHLASTDTSSAQIVMDSIFVKKDTTTGSLVKDEPVSIAKNIDSVDSVFLDEHKKLKKSLVNLNISDFNELVFSPETYFNGVKILYFANYFNLVLLNEYITYNKILDPIKKMKVFFFKNISESDKVYGRTVKTDAGYETILMANNKPIAFCVTQR
jgi:probable biosynthetic protein (TIGR04098 family)